jgi:DNA-binding transcriptional LysR family regulator
VVDLAFTRAGIPLHPTIETNSIEFMMRIVREGHAITFLNPVDIGVDVARGDLVFIPFQDLNVDPIAIKLAVRARGTLDAFPSVLVEEMRTAMPTLQRRANDDESV